MEKTKGFYDFGISYQNDKVALIKILKESYELGYRTVAIEQVFDHSKKDASKRSSDTFPAPIELSFLDEFRDKLKILNRLTIVYSDVGVAHAMTNSLNLRKYHLVAGLPKSDAALTHCCTVFNGDIISFDPDTKLLVNRKAYQMAVKRGLCFEVKYVPAIVNSSQRKEMIRIAHNYHARGKSRNIIFSSGATNEFELRGPYDVANLALIFGLTEEQGKGAVLNTCRVLFLKAESRRLGKTVMFVKQLGPTVLSSTSEDSESEDDDGEDAGRLDDNDKDMESDDVTDEQPHKKKKLS
ncbi:unnamed protein product [Hermetia illucens]|uniref:Uncharacterized protein n=1 Tax=Hermetia illucens TaxID=343691 RepID=A0A7R8YMR2_HERIL|nr:ribonuclease P protein subunit p30 [Hermetia illucens]CAD7078906.1 unnamed protein product [Hermetia illucens]